MTQITTTKGTHLNNNSKSILVRVIELERQCNNQRKVIWSLGIIAIVTISLGFTRGSVEELVLRKLVIADELGNQRIVLSAGYDVNPEAASIVYHDSEGNIRYWSGTEAAKNVNTSYYDKDEKLAQSQSVTELGSAMSIFSKSGIVQAELSWERKKDSPPRLVLGNGEILGLARMLLYGKEMNVRIAIDAQHPSGDAVIYLMDEEFEQGLAMKSTPSGETSIAVNDGAGQAGWIVSANKEQGCMMNLSDPSGADRVSLMVEKDGIGGLIMFDGNASPQAVLSTKKDGISAFHVGEYNPVTSTETIETKE